MRTHQVHPQQADFPRKIPILTGMHAFGFRAFDGSQIESLTGTIH